MPGHDGHPGYDALRRVLPGGFAVGEHADRVDFEFLHTSRGRRMPLLAARPGLVVIDVQRLFTDPASPACLPHVSPALAAITALIEAFRRASCPIVFTRHLDAEPYADEVRRHFFPRAITEEDPYSELLPEIAALARTDEVVCKSLHDSFAKALPARFALTDALFLCGVQTPLCVAATALGLARHGRLPVVVAEACAARTTADHVAALRVIAAGHGHVRSLAESLAFVRGLGA